MSVQFDVIGLPAPQGSKTRMPNGFMVEAGREKLEPWRTAVSAAAAGRETVDGPVSVWLQFRMPPVKSDPHRHRHTTKPDIDKLVRATLDALVHARLIGDDSQVWSVTATKVYAGDGEAIGCTVRVTSNAEGEAEWREKSKARAAERRKAERARAKEVA